MRRLGLAAGMVALGALLGPAPHAGTAERTLPIGYLELRDDARYDERRAAARFPAQPWGRPFDGARVALDESAFAGSAAGLRFALRRAAADDAPALAAAVRRLAGEGVGLLLLDAPGAVVDAVGRQTRGQDVLLFDLTALDDALRQEGCQPHVLHVPPSHAMLMDALGQFLVARKWRSALVLRGPRPEDAAILAAFERAARRLGVRIVDTRPFVLGRDPRERARNNVALLTAGVDHDVVVVIDGDGEFAREVPYQVQRPRPVVGAAGLVADWWHWAWERHGAPQLNSRFRRAAGRPMTGYDWSAWLAVKAIVEAAVRGGASDPRRVAAYLTGPQAALDGFKGSPVAFRPWNGQLRQPILLTTGNWVVGRAPLEGFLHARNNLDTLGFEERESRCRR
jgi:ABC transporter substrate binding protein (PQQ-dependent alcohol dehydrogenase system)